MKRAILFCIFLGCSFYSAQSQSVLNKQVDFTVKDVSIEQALDHLARVSGVSISFSNRLLPSKVRISYTFRNTQIGEILEVMLDQYGILAKTVGASIVLVKKPKKELKRYTISGYVREKESGEPLIGAHVTIGNTYTGTVTNYYGFYSITLVEGNNLNLHFSYIGYTGVFHVIVLDRDVRLDVELESVMGLEMVTIVAPAIDAEIPRLSELTIDPNDENARPPLGGEHDILRDYYSMPGVQTGADGFGGLSVRGGNVDQNLVLLDGVPVYNPTHLLGIYSVFNSSAIKSATLYKGGFPARFGGRVSSVMDVRTKEGNRNAYEVIGDIGLTSGKVSVEGPIKPGKKHSFFLSGRRSFIDFYSVPISRALRQSAGLDGEIGYFFYDLNGKANFYLGEKDQVFLSVYNGGDNFRNRRQVTEIISDTTYIAEDKQTKTWGNWISSLRWNHQYGDQLFSDLTFTYSRFFYDSVDEIENESFFNFQPTDRDYLYYRYSSNNRDFALSWDWDYSPNWKNHYIRFGARMIDHLFQPGAVQFDESFSIEQIEGVLDSLVKNPQQSYEVDFYLEDEFQVTEGFMMNLGLRHSFLYIDGVRFSYLQPRFNLLFTLPEDRVQLNLSMGKVIQPLHLLSNSGTGLPRDLWVSATERRPPIESWQWVAGTTWEINDQVTWSVEGYYKTLENLITFQEGSFSNIDGTNWQDNVVSGRGWSYGLETFAVFKFDGTKVWAGYTLSYANRQFDEVNLGEVYPFKFDRRHNINLVGIYKFNERWMASLGWTFSSGSPITLERGTYEINQTHVGGDPQPFPFILIGEVNGRKNDTRLPNYHRLDLSVSYSYEYYFGKQTLSLGIYNAYNRLNPYDITLENRPDASGDVRPQYIQVSLIPFLPSIRYRIDFTLEPRSKF